MTSKYSEEFELGMHTLVRREREGGELYTYIYILLTCKPARYTYIHTYICTYVHTYIYTAGLQMNNDTYPNGDKFAVHIENVQYVDFLFK